MNTEINFLEKQSKKNTASLFLAVLLVFLLACFIAILIYQKASYQNEIDETENAVSKMETELTDHMKENSSGLNVKQLKKEISGLETDIIPNLVLYKKALEFFASSDQLISYEYTENTTLILDAEFPSMIGLSSYLQDMKKSQYFTDIQLTSVSRDEKSYVATLTITPDTDVLMEEVTIND